MVLFELPRLNSQGRNLGCSVGFGITSSISSTQGIGLGREWLRYRTASLTNTNDYFRAFSNIFLNLLMPPCRVYIGRPTNVYKGSTAYNLVHDK